MNDKLNKITKIYDVVIVGGGVSGLCAAIASARHGAKSALVQNRPVLGGNASSEIRMHICGADVHASRPEARETGILEEILLKNRKANPQNSYNVFDTVMWEMATFQENLDLYLNTHMIDAIQENGSVKKIIAVQQTTETIFELEAKLFVDSTGDGMLGYLAGVEYMTGREGKDVFGEKYAPDKSDNITMGNSLMFTSRDMGYPVPFRKPSWAYTYEESDLKFRDHREVDAGYWWIELGGENKDIIKDGELLRDELIKCVYGAWDHIKNRGDHKADNLVLDWIGMLPGKRESRRLVGDYVLKEQDLLEGKIFEDAVAYGGWPMDMHIMGGLKSTVNEPTHCFCLDDVYTIPYRSLYSKNIKNLFLGGRNISVSHMAFGSTRDMATTSVIGQAVGTAAAMATRYGILPRDINRHMLELQQTLLKDDCHIPGLKNLDAADMARNARITCSSEKGEAACANIINGFSRNIVKCADAGLPSKNAVQKIAEAEKIIQNCWISEKMGSKGEWIALDFKESISPREIRIKFDSNLSRELTPSIEQRVLRSQIPGIPKELVKNYEIEFYLKGKLLHTEKKEDNFMRFNIIAAGKGISCDKIKINVISTHGDEHARIYEVRVY